MASPANRFDFKNLAASVDRRGLILKGLAGLAGGAIGWLPVEIVTHNHTLGEAPDAANAFWSSMTLVILCGLIGAFILASDEQKIEASRKVLLRFGRGFLICSVLAYLFIVPWSNAIFNAMLNTFGFRMNANNSFLPVMISRIPAWTLLGGLLGTSVGLASFRPPNIAKGAVGGLIGGFLGGLLFDPVGIMTGGGLISRFAGFSILGLAIGLLIGLVQELTKAAWLTVDAGRLKGRQYRLEGAMSSIGRAEENPVGLFGDNAVQARHAVIERRGNDYLLRGLAVSDGTFVNGERIESATLHDGDQIRIGSYELGFHLRGVKQSAQAIARPVQIAVQNSTPSYGAPPPATSNGSAVLIDGAGRTFPVATARETRIGRATDNDIVLADSSVSRHHAAIDAFGSGFRVRDLGSQNGTFVRGERVSEASLTNGDPVRVGDASFTFRA